MRASGDASRRTSSGTPTPSSSRAQGVPLIVIQRQLGHSNLGITSVYLQGIDNAEIIDTVHARRQPMIPVSTSLPR
jgi:integrase